MYTVYILENETTKKHYIGYTSNLERRLKEHNSGKTRSLRHKGIFQIIYSEVYNTRSEAYNREREIKKYKGGNAFRKLLF